jgi:hypothetical protein
MNRTQSISPIRSKPAWRWDEVPENAASKSDLALVRTIATWLDSAFRVPVLGTRFGLDAIIGLIPGFGDAVTSFASLFILHSASQYGVPRLTLTRMGLNIGLDWLVGSIPLLGDLFDVFWKANRRNVALLERHLAQTPADQRRHRRSDRLFVFGVIAALLMVLAASIAIAVTIITAIFRLFT